MNLKRVFAMTVSAALVFSMCSCTITIRDKSRDDVSSYDVSSYDDYSSWNYSSEEELSSSLYDEKVIGSDTVGWVTVDESFYKYYDPDSSETCVQYAKNNKDIITLDVVDGYDAETVASARLAWLDEMSKTYDITGIKGAKVTLSGKYNAYQVYCYYGESDQYLVMWFVDSPSTTKTYYIAAEFLKDDYDFVAYAETWQMPELL